jgi:ABC-type amino acid transport system permease subunit
LLLFLLFPILLKKFNLDPDKKIPEFLKIYVFDNLPKIEANWQPFFIKVAVVFAIFMEYISLKYEDLSYTPIFAHTVCLLIFAYIGYLLSDELFDTTWNSAITLISFFFVFTLFSGIINFVFIETDWTIIWMNRRTLIVGPNFISQFGNQIWRLWPPFYLLMILLGAGYGTLGENKNKFLIPFAIFSVVCILFLTYDSAFHSQSKSTPVFSGKDGNTEYSFEFFDDDDDFPDGWENQSFDDSQWSTGEAPFGNNNLTIVKTGEEVELGTIWQSDGNEGNDTYIIIRKAFAVKDTSKTMLVGGTIKLAYTNHYAAYLNGHEIENCLGLSTNCTQASATYWNKNIKIDTNWLIEKCPIGVNPQDSNNTCGSNVLVLVGQDSLYDGNDNTNWLDGEIHLDISNKGFDSTMATIYLISALALGFFAFLLTHHYYKDAEEYSINYFQNILINIAVIGFIGMIFILDPPGESTDDYFWNADWLLGTGVKPGAWGGLVLNLIFASSALVVGFGVGIALAFGRRSNLPIFWIPSVGIIELIRSGPLVAWLFFAQVLVPDLLNPIWEADIASRVILVLSLFFGCYLAEVLRGGLQAVPHGQYEAATALGLSPIQIKLQIELPQAIRTTLPAIVSMMIGMLKDTSLVYFFGIYDAFRVAKDLPAQWDFIGQHEQSLLFVGMIFWILSFYLSKISRRMEKNLGLIHEGGGEAT